MKTLARSAVPECVFQLALLLLIRLSKVSIRSRKRATYCSRRMFVVGLLVAGQVVLDKPPRISYYSTRVSGLDRDEIVTCQRDFLNAIDHRCGLTKEFDAWPQVLEKWASWLARTRDAVTAVCRTGSSEDKERISGVVKCGLVSCRAALWAAEASL